jgi:hypothetical protein
MKRVLVVLLFVVIALTVYWFNFRKARPHSNGPKETPIELKKHSAAFNASVDSMILSYLDIKDAFINQDTAGVKSATRMMIRRADSLHLDELKDDNDAVRASAAATINDIKANAESLLLQTDIKEMREDFRMVTEMMYPAFFQTINYEGRKLYLMHCPMAFGADKGADWISASPEVVNPFFGKNHPEHKDEMLHCGEVKDTIKAH